MDLVYLKKVLVNVISQLHINQNNFIVKSIWALLIYFAGIKVYIITVFVLTFIDVITGTIAAIKRGEPFKSKILKKGLIEKFFLYVLVLIAVFVFEGLTKQIINYSAYYFVFFASFLICSYELVSILENVVSINPNLTFIKPIINLVNKMQTKSISKADKMVDELSAGNKSETK